MAQLMQIPVLGLIENYSYLVCPDCGKQIDVFGKSTIDQVSKDTGIALAGRIPIESSFAEKADEGRFSEVDNTYIASALELLRKV